MEKKQAGDLPHLIALFTDFGSAGLYLGQVQAALIAAGVTVPVVDLCNNAPLCDPRSSAYLLAALSRRMPSGTLFLSVVDPGVGGERRPLLLETADHWFVGPDNGLFSQIVQGDPLCRINKIVWRPEGGLSNSFHGRDLFAPVAARVSLGQAVSSAALSPSKLAGADWPADLEQVIYIDHYGNAFTGIRAIALDQNAQLEAAGIKLSYARAFCEVEPGTAFWYENSSGLVEIAVAQGRADLSLGLSVGNSIKVIRE